jgi:NAD(P)-dependent dehydrogenase (short-subunit alcohol dehydrogenase family)
MVKKIREFLIARQPLAVQGRPEDIAQAALFFASERSSFVTGNVMAVDGGMVNGAPETGKGFSEAAKRPNS